MADRNAKKGTTNVIRKAIATSILVLAGAGMPFASAFGQAKPLGGLGIGIEDKQGPKVTASLIADQTAIAAGRPFTVGVAFDVPKGTYFNYKSAGTGLPTKISISAPAGFVVGPLRWPGPVVKYTQLKRLAISNIYKRDTVVFAKITPPADLKPGTTVDFSATTRFQYCTDAGQCFPPTPAKHTLSLPIVAPGAKVEPSDDASAIARARRALPVPGAESKYAKVRAVLNKDKLRPGDSAELAVVIDVEPGYHIQMNRPPVKTLVSTDVIVDDVRGVKSFPAPSYPQGEPIKYQEAGFEGVREYHGEVVVRVPVVARESLKGPEVTFSGVVHYQACTDKGSCFRPLYASFRTTVPVADQGAEVAPVAPELFAAAAVAVPPSGPSGNAPSGGSDVAAGGGSGLDSVNLMSANAEEAGSVWLYILYSFLGGLILNVMPCVLPVIAIKVLGFVNQAGESRGRILLLNVAYSAGVIGIFLVLATLAVVAGMGWGELFQYQEFNLIMAGVVFAMGLSLLGVFEIPIPGFSGSGGGGHQEGPAGAFATGVLATLLATPCLGPFLTSVLVWSAAQPALMVYLVWGTIGLGMSSPYLLFGMFPSMVKWLPKPGNWMVRFKEFAGFVLMATVVYLVYVLDDTNVLPALVMLLGLALGFWMIGNLYDINSHIRHKTLVRVTAIALSAGICLFAFTKMKSIAEGRERFKEQKIAMRILSNAGKAGGVAVEASDSALPWQPFSEARMKELSAEGKTLLIDFTASWCLNCHVNEAVALETKETRELVDRYGIIPLLADYSDSSPEIKRWIKQFGGAGVPLTVIIPADAPDRPIAIHAVYSKETLLEKLREAGPSRGIDLDAKRVAARG